MPHTFSIDQSLSDGWSLVRGRIRFFVVLAALAFGTLLLTSAIVGAVNQVSQAFAGILDLGVSALEMIMTIGFLRIMFAFHDGSYAEYADLFRHYRVFWKYLGASLLRALIVVLACLVFILPGVYLAIRLSFVDYLVVDREEGPWTAIKHSWALTKGKFFKLCGLLIILGAINMLGAIFLGVGLILTVPMTLGAIIRVYRNLLSEEGTTLS